MNSKLSIFFFGGYLSVLGAVLMLIPNFALPIFGFEPVSDVWIRVLGMVFFVMSWMYYWALSLDMKSFYLLTVFVRYSAAITLTTFYLAHLAPWPIIGFAIFDTLTATWTLLSLRYEQQNMRILLS